jgi:hypothetical protein
MKIIANLDTGKLLLPDAVYPVSNRIRTVRNGTRKSYEIVRTIPDNFPYDPQPFPKGLWRVTGLDWQKEKGFDPRTYGPVKIRTDAWQLVNVWKVDAEGDYLRETSLQVKDMCYWLHYSAFNTTLGCIRLASPKDAIAIANTIARALDQREEVILEVV